MMEYNMAAVLESKMAAISGIISTYLGLWGVRNLSVNICFRAWETLSSNYLEVFGIGYVANQAAISSFISIYLGFWGRLGA